MQSARTRISESSFLLAALVTATLVAVPGLAYAVNEFPDPAPKKTNSFQTSPTYSVQSSQTQRTDVPGVRVLRAPDLVGKDAGSARAGLQSIGLRAGREIARQTTDDRPGTVLAQDPKPGTPMKPGDAITMWVAAAPPWRDPRGTRPSDVVAQPAKPDHPVSPPKQSGPSTSDGPAQPPSTGVVAQPPAIVLPPKPHVVVVPNLVTRSAGEAPALLHAANLAVGEQRREESEAPVGTVTSQTPVAGVRVLAGTPVSVAVAVPILVLVPELTGHSARDARDLLASARLALGEHRTQPSDAREGTVLGQTPGAGTRVLRGTRVSMVIAVPDLVSVPDITGETWEQAQRALGVARLSVGERRRRESDARAGTVLGQSPAAGSRVRPGTPVSVVVAVPVPAPAPVVSVPLPVPVVSVPLPVPPPTKPTAPAPQPAPTPRATRRPPEPVPLGTTTPPAPAAPAPAPAAKAPTPTSPIRLHWGIASALLLGAGAGAIYYRTRTTRTLRQQPVTAPKLDFAPRWDAGRQQLGPAGPLSSGSGLRLVTGFETSTASLEDDHLVAAAHDNGGLRR